MNRLIIDEDFDHRLLRRLKRVQPTIDIVTPSELGLLSSPDPILLEEAARLGRIMLSFDKRTMSAAAYERILTGKSFPGIFLIKDGTPFDLASEDIILIAFCEAPERCQDQVRYIPLQ